MHRPGGDGAGPQDEGLHRLFVGALVVIEQRKLLLLSSFRAQLPTQVAQRQVVEGEAALSGPHQVGRQRGVRRHAGQRPAASGQVVDRDLGLVQRLRRAPGPASHSPRAASSGGVNVAVSM